MTVILPTYSASRISTYAACHRLGRAALHNEATGGDEAMRGSLVHGALERAARKRLDTPADERIPADRKELRALVRSLAVAWKPEPPSAFVLREALDALPGDPVDFSATVAVESEAVILIDGVEIHAHRDRIDKRNGKTIIHDYKTGAYVKSGAELEDDPQWLIYGLISREEDPWDEIELAWVYTARDVTVRREWEPAFHDRHARDVISRVLADIKADQAREAAGDPAAWEPTPSPMCSWCPIAATCPALTAPTKPATLDPKTMPTPAIEAEARTLQKERQAREKREKLILGEARLRMENGAKVEALTYVPHRITELPHDDPDSIMRALAQAVGETPESVAMGVMGVSEGRLRRWLGRLSEERRDAAEAALASLRVCRDVSPYVKVKK